MCFQKTERLITVGKPVSLLDFFLIKKKKGLACLLKVKWLSCISQISIKEREKTQSSPV